MRASGVRFMFAPCSLIAGADQSESCAGRIIASRHPISTWHLMRSLGDASTTGFDGTSRGDERFHTEIEQPACRTRSVGRLLHDGAETHAIVVDEAVVAHRSHGHHFVELEIE